MNLTNRTQTVLQQAETCIEHGEPEKALDLLRPLTENANDAPTSTDESMWRVHELIGACFHDLGDADGAAQAYFNAVQTDDLLSCQRQHYANYLFNLHYLPTVGRPNATAATREQIAAVHFAADNFYRDITPLPPPAWHHDKTRLGYIAPRFGGGAVAGFYSVLLDDYDKKKFTVTCYDVTELREKNGLSWEEIASVVRRDETDILIDLGGHSAGGVTLPIMAHRPAKIQLSGWGWFDTTGLVCIDYLIADDRLVPPGEEKYFREQILRLPYAFCYTPPPELQKQPPPRPKHGTTVVCGCFANYMKITDEWLAVWREIHAQIPAAVLVLQDVTPLAARQRYMTERIAALGLSGSIKLKPSTPDYGGALAQIDLVLDTFPYPGGAMTAAALYSGVPVVTLAGSGYGSRFGGSLLHAAGLGEFVTTDCSAYIQKIVSLMRDGQTLADWHDRLRDKVIRSPLMNREQYMAHYEAVLLTLL